MICGNAQRECPVFPMMSPGAPAASAAPVSQTTTHAHGPTLQLVDLVAPVREVREWDIGVVGVAVVGKDRRRRQLRLQPRFHVDAGPQAGSVRLPAAAAGHRRRQRTTVVLPRRGCWRRRRFQWDARRVSGADHCVQVRHLARQTSAIGTGRTLPASATSTAICEKADVHATCWSSGTWVGVGAVASSQTLASTPKSGPTALLCKPNMTNCHKPWRPPPKKVQLPYCASQ
jgi:hypothetical protein